MPLLGLYFGELINNYFIFNIGFVVPIIFSIIGFEMIISSTKNEDVNIMISLIGFFLFGLSVSIDSFTTGIGLSFISSNYLICSVVFMVISALFTFIGLNFGCKLSDKFGKYATLCGGVIMLILSIYYLLRV